MRIRLIVVPRLRGRLHFASFLRRRPLPAFLASIPALLTALFLSTTARAQQQTATITFTGTVLSGFDTTGVFGPPNTFLTGQPFTLTYTFDATMGTQAESCVLGIDCTSSITGNDTSSPGGATIQIGTSLPVIVDSVGAGSSTASRLTAISSTPPPPFLDFVSFTTQDTSMYVEVASTFTETSLYPNFDWRSTFYIPFESNTILSGEGTFNINEGSATGVLTPFTISETGVICQNPASVKLAVNNIGGKQPNILGGNFVDYNFTTDSVFGNVLTDVDVTVSPLPIDSWTAVTFGDTDLGQHEFLDSGAVPDSSGFATMQYQTTYTNGANQISTGQLNDKLVGTVCQQNSPPASSSPITIYEYYPYLNKAHLFDIAQSQVSDSVFTEATALSATQIQTFLSSAQAGSLLARFYFDTKTGTGGWAIPVATGKEINNYNGTDDAYCPTSVTCPTTGDTGTLAAYVIADVAARVVAPKGTAPGLNPEVILATLQKESSMISRTEIPDNVTPLNAAMGCGSGTFNSEITCGAKKLMRWYNDTNVTYPYFFPVNKAEKAGYPNIDVTHSLQYSYGTFCNEFAETHVDCGLVGFWITTASTYAQYKYTAFVQTAFDAETGQGSGGVYSFDYFFTKYNDAGWYQ